ncbi:MAG: hypothetical protein AAF802_33370 [Planctomycetota bacterium]
MRYLAFIVVCIPLFTGCWSDRPRPQPAKWIDLHEVDSLTLVAWELTLDGGTSTLGAVTDDGYLCSIRLNQHSLAGEFPLDTDASPGRLFFNDALIDVRSSEEKHLIDLLRRASVASVKLGELRRLAQDLPIDYGIIGALAVDDDDDLLERSRDEIVVFVLSDAYVDIARNGIPGSESG